MDYGALLAAVSTMGMCSFVAHAQAPGSVYGLHGPSAMDLRGPGLLAAGDTPGDPVWVNAGLGGSELGLAYDVSINLMHRRTIYSVDAWGSSSKEVFTLFGPGPWDNFSSYNFTFSRVISGDDDVALVSVGAGISLSSMTYRTAIPGTAGFLSGPDLKGIRNSTIGLPLVLGFCIPTCSAVGFEMAMRGDLNNERSIYSLVLGLRIGRIRCSGRGE